MSVLTPLEVASSLVLGSVEGGRRSTVEADPRAAMERALVEPLRRGPCLVSFSGGRDSSAVLAVATAVARREGLAPPIPATLRFPTASDTAETEWQESVVSHLGLDDWIRLEATDELDCVGPVATAALARHGLLWPSNAHFHTPLFAHAHGGSFLTGIGGDEMLGPSRWLHARRVLAGQVRPRPRDVLAVAFALAPPRVRRLVTRRRMRAPFPWLRDDVVEHLERELATTRPPRRSAGAAASSPAPSHRYLHVVRPEPRDARRRRGRRPQPSLPRPRLRLGARLAAARRSLREPARRDGRALRRRAARRGALAPHEGVVRRARSGTSTAASSSAGGTARASTPASSTSKGCERNGRADAPDPRTYTLLQSVKLALDLPGSAGEHVEQPLPRLVEAVPASRPAELPAG